MVERTGFEPVFFDCKSKSVCALKDGCEAARAGFEPAVGRLTAACFTWLSYRATAEVPKHLRLFLSTSQERNYFSAPSTRFPATPVGASLNLLFRVAVSSNPLSCLIFRELGLKKPAGKQGFEPQFSGPEPDVLPLNYFPMSLVGVEGIEPPVC